MGRHDARGLLLRCTCAFAATTQGGTAGDNGAVRSANLAAEGPPFQRRTALLEDACGDSGDVVRRENGWAEAETPTRNSCNCWGGRGQVVDDCRQLSAGHPLRMRPTLPDLTLQRFNHPRDGYKLGRGTVG
jgi:hypothetical protein